MKKSAVVFVALWAFLVPSTSFAVTLQATETIEDVLELTDLIPTNRDLGRTRTDSTGTVVMNNDATIVSENQVNDAFGRVNLDDVSYKHDLSWINPAADSFVSLALRISAFGALGNNEPVVVDTFNLGVIPAGSLGTLFFSTFVFQNSNPAQVNAVLADGMLEVNIEKNAGAGFLGSLNALSIYKSELQVGYEPVPEPSTVALLVLALVGGIIVRRRQALAN